MGKALEEEAEAERLRKALEEEAEAERFQKEQEAALRIEEERLRLEADLAAQREREEAAAAADEAARKKAEAAAEATRQEMAKHAAEQRQDAVQKFLADHKFKGVNTGRKSLTKTTYPLHEAAKQHDIKMVKMLVEEGANVNQTNSRKQTPLQRATRENKNGSHEEIIGVLTNLSTERAVRAGGA